jgi:nitrite reductase (NADH) large subunit
MSESNGRAWRCIVCGYIHYGPHAPEECPLCGAPRDEFEICSAPPKPAEAAPAVRRWRCIVCGCIHDGAEPLTECPLCGAARDEFEPLPDEAPAGSGAPPERVVVIGAGIAGVAAVEALRSAAPEMEITLVSKEISLPYYRINLTRYLAGEVGQEELCIHSVRWYEDHAVRLLQGVEVASLELEDRAVTLTSGRRLACDKLILTAGAHAFLPPLPGIEREGVCGLRTLEDAARILAAAQPGARVVIIGGGILGLEAAGALARRGARVSVLEGFGWLLPRQLNRRAGELLAAHVAGLGVTVRPLAATREIVGAEGRATGVALESGEVLPADLVIVATGIRSNTHLARQAGLAVGQGVIVDDHLTASHPAVLAAGDAAEHRGVVYGLWGASQAQGRLAGLNAAGGKHEFGGLPRANTLKVLDIDLFSIGRIDPEDASTEVLEQELGGAYYRFLVHDQRLAGAILLGDTRAAGVVKKAVENGRDLSGLLIARPGAAELAQGMMD